MPVCMCALAIRRYFSHHHSAVTATSSKVEGFYQKIVSVGPTSECVLASTVCTSGRVQVGV